MIVKTVSKTAVHDNSKNSNREFWLSKDPIERLNAVEFLRKQFYAEYPKRLQRVYSIIKQK